jgi:hypothetical protein
MDAMAVSYGGEHTDKFQLSLQEEGSSPENTNS